MNLLKFQNKFGKDINLPKLIYGRLSKRSKQKGPRAIMLEHKLSPVSSVIRCDKLPLWLTRRTAVINYIDLCPHPNTRGSFNLFG